MATSGTRALPSRASLRRRHPRLALARLVAAQALAHAGVEVVSDDPGRVLTSQLNERPSVLECRVGVVHDHGASLLQRILYELCLSPVRVPVVAKQVLADVLVGRGEALVEERALSGSLQTDEYDQLHIREHHNSPHEVALTSARLGK